MAMTKTQAHYKVSNFVNHVTQWKDIDDGRKLENYTPGAVWSEGLKVRDDDNSMVKTPWNFMFFSGGTVVREFLLGKNQYTQC